MRGFTLIACISLTNCIYAQKGTTNKRWHTQDLDHFYFSNDTVVKKGIKFRVTNFAIQGGFAGIKYFHDRNTEKYLGNYWNWTEDIFIYYKNFFYGAYVSPATVHLKDTLYFDSYTLNKDEPLEVLNLSILFGYHFDLSDNFSAEPYAAFTFSGIGSDNPLSHKPEPEPGFGFGFYFNRYIQLRPKRYLVVFVRNNFSQVYYSKLNSALGNNFYSFSFGLAYKAWFLKKIKE